MGRPTDRNSRELGTIKVRHNWKLATSFISHGRQKNHPHQKISCRNNFTWTLTVQKRARTETHMCAHNTMDKTVCEAPLINATGSIVTSQARHCSKTASQRVLLKLQPTPTLELYTNLYNIQQESSHLQGTNVQGNPARKKETERSAPAHEKSERRKYYQRAYKLQLPPRRKEQSCCSREENDSRTLFDLEIFEG